MKFPTYLHRNSYDIWYFRIAVPAKFRQYVGKTELKQSLGTRSTSVAIRQAQLLAAQAHQLFDKIAMNIDDDWLLSKQMTLKNVSIDLGNGKKLQVDEVEVDPSKPGDQQAWIQTIAAAKGQAVAPVEPLAKNFSELFKEYLVVRKQKKKTFRDATVSDYTKKAALFVEILDDRPINQYTFEDADKLLSKLQKLPKNWKKTPKYRNVATVHEVTNMNIPEEERMALGTINTFMSITSGIFRLAVTRGYIPYNPFAEKQVQDERSHDERWQPFSTTDLNKIFSPSTFKVQPKFPSHYWAVLLAALQGARSNEICQLKSHNITTVGGFPCIKFTDDGEDQEVKGRNSKRVIPIHQKLIDLGFVDYVNSRPAGSMLFPELTQGADNHWDRNLRRWFNEKYLPKIGVKRERISFRSFRRAFITTLRTAKVNETFVAELVGHAKNKGSYTAFKTYASRGEVPPLIEALNTIQYDFLEDLPKWPQ